MPRLRRVCPGGIYPNTIRDRRRRWKYSFGHQVKNVKDGDKMGKD